MKSIGNIYNVALDTSSFYFVFGLGFSYFCFYWFIYCVLACKIGFLRSGVRLVIINVFLFLAMIFMWFLFVIDNFETFFAFYKI